MNDATILGVEEAVIVRSRQFWGRADGLLAIRYANGNMHTVVIEAKSTRARHQVRSKDGCFAMFSATFASSVALAWLVVLLLHSHLPSTWTWLFGIAGGVAGGLFMLRWAASSSKFQSHAVIDQIQRYPAAHRWIAIAGDMKRELTALKKACSERSLGVLVVPRRGDPWVEVEPRGSQRDFLVHYKRELEIRQRMATSTRGVHIEVRPGE